MPFTPFHVGPHATIAFSFSKFIDIPVFILANIAVDLEPLTVLVFKFDYPLHGYFHSFIFGGLVGLIWGVSSIKIEEPLTELMNRFYLPYSQQPFKAIVSGVLGVWFHILFDATMYGDIKPFFPFESNPLLGLKCLPNMYFLCLLFFPPALILHILAALKYKKDKEAVATILVENASQNIFFKGQRSMNIGRALIDEGLISENELQQAINEQNRQKIPLDRALVLLNFVFEMDICLVLSKFLRIPFIDLSNYEIDSDIARMVPTDVAKRLRIIAMNKVGNQLTVAMVDPLDENALAEIRSITKHTVKQIIAGHSDIMKAIDEYCEK